MEKHTSFNNLNINKAVATIGSFDGVHCGHCQVVNELCKSAKLCGGQSVVISFSQHPLMVLGQNQNFRLLTTPAEQAQLLEQMGVDHLIQLPFTKEFAQTEYDVFVKRYLVDMLHIDTLLLGYDNKFGKGGRGTFAAVEQLSRQLGFTVKALPALTDGQKPISSTQIRNLLASGNVEQANVQLGYSYFIEGEVVAGNQIGSKIGFPTANISAPQEKTIPAHGVYAVRVKVAQTWYNGMLNIGNRPTIGSNNPVTLEVNIFDFNETLYGQRIRVELVAYVRNEKRFASLDELKAQIAEDKRLIEQKMVVIRCR